MRGLLLAVIAAVLLAACGGADVAMVPQGGALINPAPSPDSEDPFGTVDGKLASASFRKFFLDSVNYRSQGRWTGWNAEPAQGTWHLTDFGFAPTGTWDFVGDEPNAAGTLTSRPFTMPAGISGNKISFRANWVLYSGSSWFVELRRGSGNWQQIAEFQLTNPLETGYDKYILGLPDAGVADEQWQVRFRVQANDTARLGRFVSVDAVSVYQTRLEPPVNVTGSFDQPLATVSWAPNPVGPRPESYDIWLWDDNANEPSAFYTNVPYGTWQLIVGGDTGTTYHVKIKAKRAGWDDSSFSNEVSTAPDDPL